MLLFLKILRNQRDAIEWKVRNLITKRIIESATEKKLSATFIAKEAGTSRASVTKILKDDSFGTSIDVLIRILCAVGEEMKISFKKAA